MATRWLKWNESTHIFEYSTDGVNYSPLPLNASVLNEGSISDALLSSNIPRKDGANVFTNALPISLESTEPVLQLKETDQGADLKNWRIGASGGILNVDKLTDALASTNLLNLNRDGILSVLAQAAGSHLFSVNANGTIELIVRNLSAGGSALSILKIGNDSTPFAGRFVATSSGSAFAAPYGPDTVSLDSALSGGLNINAFHASGALKFLTGGSTTPRMTIASSGAVTLTSTITERGRTAPMGEWTAYSPTVNNLTIGNGSLQGYYARVGTVTFWRVFILFGSTTSITGALSFTLPTAVNAANAVHWTANGIAYNNTGGARYPLVGIITANQTVSAYSAVSPITPVTSTVPFTWNTSAQFLLGGFYRDDS